MLHYIAVIPIYCNSINSIKKIHWTTFKSYNSRDGKALNVTIDII